MIFALLIIFGILLFNLIIFAHEFGHFFWAKKFGVKVNEFALGMGPKIFKFKKGETLFSLRAFPIGGFCDMEEDVESESPDSFANKKAWQKIIIVASGAIMNLILGFIMTFVVLCQANTLVSNSISKFAENAVSSSYGLKENDEIIKINGSTIYSYKDIGFNFFIASNKESFNIRVKRDGQIIDLENVKFHTISDENGINQIKPDFYLKPIEKNFGALLKATFLDTISTVKTVWEGLLGVIKGQISFKSMSGPIGIATVIGEQTSAGLQTSVFAAFMNIFGIMTLITINLGIFNLLPLPALDGGRIVFLLIELITRKKINPKHEGWIHTIGFFLLIGLLILISCFDVAKLFGKG